MSPHPNHTRFLIGALLLLAAWAIPFPQAAADAPDPAARADATAVADAGQPDLGATATEQASAPARFLTLPLDRLTPMQQEIRLRIEQEQLELARLSAAYANAKSDEEALALQKQIHAVKAGAEQAVLQIQLDYARAEGRLDSVLQLERALAVLERGSVERQSANRAHPGDAHQ